MKTYKFKQTNISKSLKDWETVVISEAVDVNPKRELKKGTFAKYVSMSDLMEFNKNIHNFCIREYKGGSKFMDGDTIMARITPCLENGKTAFVDFLNENETGFGSTEFIVLSAKQGWTTPHYVYYLAISREVREQAIQSMTGTSGRQRVDTDVFDNIFIKLPPVNIQRAIAKILSDLDDKIELNRQINKILESIAQAIFKHWFIDFEFPDEEGKPYKSHGGEFKNAAVGSIPKKWNICEFGDMVELLRIGIKPTDFPHEFFLYHSIPAYDINQIAIYELGSGIKSNKFLLGGEGCILLSKLNPRIQRVWLFKIVGNHRAIASTEFLVLKPKYPFTLEYIYALCKLPIFYNEFSALVTGTSSSHQRVKPKDVLSINVVSPQEGLVKVFTNTVQPLYQQTLNHKEQNIDLANTRDLLLPRLMKSQIKI